MGRIPISHFVVLRGGIPCQLVADPNWAPVGVLVLCQAGEAPTRFLCDRATFPRSATIFARRQAAHAITRTAAFIDATRDSMADCHPLVARIMTGPLDWEIAPVQCRTKAHVEISLEESRSIAAHLKISALKYQSVAEILPPGSDATLLNEEAAALDSFADKLYRPFGGQELVESASERAEAAFETTCRGICHEK